MGTLTPAAVRRQIASGKPDSIYLLQGEDDVEQAALAGDLAGLVEQGLEAFNVERIHAAEMTTGERLADGVARLTEAVRTLPMMVPRRVVIVLQADVMLMPRRESEAATAALDRLETLLKQPEPQTVLVLVAGPLDKRSRIYRLLLKQATIVECGTVADHDEAERWLRTHAAAAGAELEPSAARLIASRAGPDIKRLRGDLDRLLLYALGQKRITLDDARQVVGPAALQDDWAMTNAIEAGQAAEALRQLALMLDAGVPGEKILGQLGWVVRAKLGVAAPSALPMAVDAVFRTDLDLKRSAADARILLERLVVELCSARRAPSLGSRR